MCPFCFIGKRLFDQALDSFPGKDLVEVRWRSYHLFPGVAHQPGRPAREVLAEVKGLSPRAMQDAIDQVSTLGKTVGISFDFGALQMADTTDALRLVHLAARHGRGGRMKERLFQAFFEQGRNLEDAATLVALGREVGLAESEVREMLASRLYADEFEADVMEARQRGIRGIPFFLLNGRDAYFGSRPVADFQEALAGALADWQRAVPTVRQGAAAPGDSCGLDGQCA